MSTQIGLKDLYYALLTTDTEATVLYATPVKMAPAITANINPNPSMETLFADDGPMDTASTLGQIDLELAIADLPLDVQAIILGHTITAGVMVSKSSDVAPFLAIGFRSLKSNGKYRYTWLTKGKFREPEMKNETKGDKVAFQTPTINGSFLKRDHDEAWKIQTDEDATGYVADSGDDWFTAATLAV